MPIRNTLCATLLALSGLLPVTAAADAGRGERLHEAHCIACHARQVGGDGSAIYTREDRRVNSLPALKRQVRFCKQNLELTWFDDEVADVVDYLNRTYYKF